VTLVCGAMACVLLGGALVWGGALLLWGGRVNEGRSGSEVWTGTNVVAEQARRLGLVLLAAGTLGLGPGIWVLAALGR
jgi:hypothetical protein